MEDALGGTTFRSDSAGGAAVTAGAAGGCDKAGSFAGSVAGLVSFVLITRLAEPVCGGAVAVS